MLRIISVLTASLLFFFVLPAAWSATYYVPDDFAGVQDAISSVMDGDTIVVRAGTYFENIDYLGHRITVRSEQGPDVTIIDGSNMARVVTFQSGEGADSVLEGFTITNGNGTQGGGIYCYQAGPSVRDCIVRDNIADEGGGIYALVETTGMLSLIGCKLLDNRTPIGIDGPNPGDAGLPGGNGAGIYLDGGTLELTDCEFQDNSTGGGGVGAAKEHANGGSGGRGGRGSALYMQSGSSTMLRCMFYRNRTGSGGKGAGCSSNYAYAGAGGAGGYGTLYIASGDVTLTGVVFDANWTGRGGDAGEAPHNGTGGSGGVGGHGFGIYLSSGQVMVEDSTFTTSYSGNGGNGGASNSHDGGAGGSGGSGCIFLGSGSSLVVQNTKIANNRTGNGGDGGRNGGIVHPGGAGGNGGNGCGLYLGNQTASLENCLLTGNQVGSGGLGGTGPGGLNGPDGREGKGGGVYRGGAAGTIINTTIADNASGIDSFEGSVENSIIYGNTTDQIVGVPTVSYSDVQGGYSGIGNIDVDPLFIANPPFGDYFLEQDPCQSGVTNLCVDGGDPTSPPITGTTRTDLLMDDASLDMGYHYPSVILVPGHFGSIQAAINASSPGNSILVKPGDYVENLDFAGKQIEVRSDANGNGILDEYDFAPRDTIIDGGGAGSVVTFNSSESTDAVIEGFTLTNGEHGVSCVAASPTIRNCVISGNVSPDFGGGIFCDQAPAVIQNNLIEGNIASVGGGGICCDYSDAVIINSTITGNDATEGGGLRCLTSSPSVTGSILWDNTASSGNPEISLDAGSDPQVTFSDIEGGWPGEGNIGIHPVFHDPLFVDPASGDLHLQKESPCINRGTNAGIWIRDMDGIVQPFMGTVDMGCFEYATTHILKADRFALDVKTGGIVIFNIDAGSQFSERGYVIIGSLSGTVPGVYLPGGGGVLRLRWDSISAYIYSHLNNPMFVNFSGLLDTKGRGFALFNTNGKIHPTYAGQTLSFAMTLLDPYEYTSNPINVELLDFSR